MSSIVEQVQISIFSSFSALQTFGGGIQTRHLVASFIRNAFPQQCHTAAKPGSSLEEFRPTSPTVPRRDRRIQGLKRGPKVQGNVTQTQAKWTVEAKGLRDQGSPKLSGKEIHKALSLGLLGLIDPYSTKFPILKYYH